MSARVIIESNLRFSRWRLLRGFPNTCSICQGMAVFPKIVKEDFEEVIWISRIHHFFFIFTGYITIASNDHLLEGSLAQLARALHRYHRDQDSIPKRLNLSQVFFSQLLYGRLWLRWSSLRLFLHSTRFKKVKFMFSSLHKVNKFNGLLQRATASQQHNRKQINARWRNQNGLGTIHASCVL